MKKVLLISNLVPYPKDNGGKIFSNSLILSLKELGYSIDLVCFHDTNDSNVDFKELNNNCNSYIVEKKIISLLHKKTMILIALASLLSRFPFSQYKFKSKKMSKIIKSLIKENHYDYFFLGCLAVTPYKKVLRNYQPNTPIILCEQNCETIIMKRRLLTEKSFLMKLFLHIEIKKLQKSEKDTILFVNKSIILSQNDYSFLEQIVGKPFPHSIIPIGISNMDKKEFTFCPPKTRLLFVGTLTWEPNSEGLIWFLKNVMPKLDSNLYSLEIIGRGASEQLIKEARKFRNVSLIGYVESLDNSFNSNDCLVVPLFVGSGQRVKILESFARGMPIISTSIGAEGIKYTQGRDIFIANSSTDFVYCIESLKNLNLLEISKNEIHLFNTCYSISSVSKKLGAFLKK